MCVDLIIILVIMSRLVTVCDIILRGGSGSNVTSHILKNIKNMFFQFIQK